MIEEDIADIPDRSREAEHGKHILLVDDHQLFREGLKAIIKQAEGFEVVGEAGSGNEAFIMAMQLLPDIIVMDISLPDTNGIDLTRKILDLLEDTKIIILSMHSKVNFISRAFQAGAMGYVVKESAYEMLQRCLQSVANGEEFIDSSLSHEVAEGLKETFSKAGQPLEGEYEKLTRREQEVLRLLGEGYTRKKIGETLYISHKTVENHRTNIMNKLGLNTTSDLVRYAIKIGLVDVDTWEA